MNFSRISKNRRLAALAVACASLVGVTAAHADYLDLRGVAPIQGDASAGGADPKTAVCVACHGPGGNAVVPTFPRLAGQRADYLYWELLKFKDHLRPTLTPMPLQIGALSDQEVRNLAVYFATQKPTTPASTPVDGPQASRGDKLFHEGDPSRGVPPCQGCHGAEALGIPGARFITWPALRGQHAAYLTQRLKDFRDAKPADTSNDFVMQGVAHTLDDESIHAIATYLDSLQPEAAR